MPVKTLLVTRIKGLEQALDELSPDGIEWVRTKDDVATRKAIGAAEIILADPDLIAAHLAGASSLIWLQATFAGIEPLLLDGHRSDYQLTRLKGIFGPQMAEYVLGHILAREHDIVGLRRDQERHRWNPRVPRKLSSLTLGILGAGDIGSAVASVAGQFGMTVWGLRTRDEPVDGVDQVFTREQMAPFLAGSDYLVDVLPSTPDTVGLLSGDRLKGCKPGAVLINIGRGDVIDEASLVRAVEAGWIAGAILDVFATEPLPADSPLWELEEVTVTPHVAASSFPADVIKIFGENLERHLSQRPLEHLVDWAKGY